MSKIEDLVEKLAEPVVEQFGCSLVDLEFKKEGADWFLRLYIDKPNGVSIDDCEAVSRALSDVMDAEDPIEQAYYLEVSSPGMGRKLKKEREFKHYVGRLTDIKLYSAINNKKEFTAKLKSYDNDNITVEADGEEISFNKKQAVWVKLHEEF